MWIPVLAGISLLLGLADVRAQTPTSTIIGVVRDASGLPVPEAAATVRNTGTGDEVHTKANGQGVFTVPNLPRGEYDVTVEKAGFQPQRQTGIELAVQQEARIEIRLTVGSLSQVVDVKAEVPLINTEDGSRGEVFDHNEIELMPGQGSGRQFSNVAYLMAGVTSGPQGLGGSSISANGARPDNTNILVDGTGSRDMGTGYPIAIDSTNIESIQEIKMLTNNYSAEYGTISGGVMTVALKAGTNQLHGSGYEFTHRSEFDARNFFSITKPPLSYYDTGAELDGPVMLPHLYDGRNRTFFMVSYEFWDQHTPLTGAITVPTALVREGDFSQTPTASGAPTVLKNPFNGNAPFPNAMLPASLINPIAQKLLQYWPNPQVSGQVNNAYNSLTTYQLMGRTSVKIDQIITSSDRLTVKIATDATRYQALGVITNTVDTFLYPKRRTWPVPGLSYFHSFTPSLMMEVRVGLNRNWQYTGSSFLGQNIATQLGIPGLPSGAFTGFPFFNVTGYSQIGDSASNPNWQVTETYQESANLTWVKGKHVVKFGGEALRGHLYETNTTNANGSFQFLGNWTSNAFADFLLGLPDSASRLENPNVIYMDRNLYGAFIQDDFKVLPNLTLNLGLRYDLILPPSEKYGRWSNFLPSTDQIAIASAEALPNLQQELAATNETNKVVLASQVGLPWSLAHTDKLNFGPRVGFAWRPFGGNRTSIRGGYGISYSTDLLASYFSYMAGEYPFTISQTFSRQASNPNALTLSNPFPAALAAIGGTTSVGGTPLNLTTPRVHNYNLTFEHELGRSTALEVAYSGSAGRDLSRAYNINQPYYYQPQYWLPNGTIPSPYPAWGSINYITNGSVSNYNAGLFTLRHQMNHGLMFRVNYTWSKSLDDASLLTGTTTGGFSGVQDARNPSLEYGRSDFDARNIFSFSMSYETQFHSRFTHGWLLSATGRGSSGFPLTPQTSASNQALGQAPRPDRICNGTLSDPTPQDWFNKACFVPVPSGAFRPGNSGRGIINGPGYEAFNISVSRVFRFAERYSLQIRCDASNFLNHTNFYEPNINVNVAAGATVSQADNPRQVQLAARIQF
jgi:hypothetical protein